ncbi:MAG TPA: hypothetical protein ENF95_00625 [Candidatus Aenigmarchaeota archaeon]|nr:hypothetical protein [Candidatus Aenigmarchaeota archaeon]
MIDKTKPYAVFSVTLCSKVDIFGKKEVWFDYTFEIYPEGFMGAGSSWTSGGTPSPQFLNFVLQSFLKKVKEMGIEQVEVKWSEKAKEYYEENKDRYIPHQDYTFEEAMERLDDPDIFRGIWEDDAWALNDIRFALRKKLSDEEVERTIEEKRRKAYEYWRKSFEEDIKWYLDVYLSGNFDENFPNFKRLIDEINEFRERLGMPKLYAHKTEEELKKFIKALVFVRKFKSGENE